MLFRSFNGTSNVGVTNFTNIDSITSAANGTLTSGLAGPTTWTISGSDSGTVLDSGNTLTFTNFGSLTGGAGNDTFAVVTGGSLTGAVNGSGGVNTLDYSGDTAVITVSVASGGGTSIAGGFSNIQNLIGNDGVAGNTFTLIGDNTGDAFSITGGNSGSLSYNSGGSVLTFSGVGNLTGGTGNDAFTFGAAGALGGTLDGGAGVDSLDISALGVGTVNLTADGANGYNGNAPVGPAGGFKNIDSITAADPSTLDASALAGDRKSVV